MAGGKTFERSIFQNTPHKIPDKPGGSLGGVLEEGAHHEGLHAEQHPAPGAGRLAVVALDDGGLHVLHVFGGAPLWSWDGALGRRERVQDRNPSAGKKRQFE